LLLGAPIYRSLLKKRSKIKIKTSFSTFPSIPEKNILKKTFVHFPPFPQNQTTKTHHDSTRILAPDLYESSEAMK